MTVWAHGTRAAAMMAVAVMGGMTATAAAATTTDVVLAKALELQQGGHTADAFALLMPLERTRAGDPGFDYLLALAAIDSGHPDRAIIALQRVLAVQPTNAQARAELARAYALTGDVEMARREFDTVAGDPTVPDPVRQRFNSLVRGLDHTLRPGSSVTGYAEVGGGYDSNVNAATSASQLVIPVFSFLGPATLSGNARRLADGFGSAELGISGDYGFDRQSRLFASLLGSGRFNVDQTQLSQTLGSATLGYAHTAANRDVASLSLQTQQFLLGGRHYRAAVGAVAQYTHLLPGGSALSGQLQAFAVRYPNDPNRDARRYGAGVSYVTRVVYVAVQGGREEARRASAHELSNSYGGARVAFERPLNADLALFGAVAFEARRYAGIDPLFLVRRHDDQYDASAGVRFRLATHLTAAPQVAYTRNRSDIAIDDYERVVASAAVRLDF